MKPHLTINGRTRNGWIENRHPPVYGDGRPAGCVSQGEFEVHIQLGKDNLTGIVQDVNSKKPVSFSQVKAIGTSNIHVVSTTDSLCKFQIPYFRNVSTLLVMAPGYRELLIRPHF